MANVSKIRTTDGTLYTITGSGQSGDTTYTFSGSASATGYTITITPSTGTVQTVTIPLAVAADAGLLSPSDFAKLAGIESGAEVNVQSDWNVTNTSSDAFIKNKPTIPSASSTTPVMDGTGAAGSSSNYARADHVHPTDTSRQAALVSGTNIKTVNNNSLLGSGDVAVQPTLVSGTNIKTVNNNSLLGSGNITISGGSTVSASADLSSGTKIGTVTVDSTVTDFYSPTPPSATSTTPAMDGVASVGSETTYARGDHVHPTDTSRQETLISGTNIKTINNESILGSGDITISGGGGGEIRNPSSSSTTLPVDTWTNIGPTLTLDAGVWIITAAVNIPACGSSAGKKGVRIYDVAADEAVSTSTNYICSNVNSFLQIQSVAIVSPTATQTYRVQGYIASVFTSVSATGSIKAVSITNNTSVSIIQDSDNSLLIS